MERVALLRRVELFSGTPDPDLVWQEPWLRVCGLYATPTVLGDRAAELARRWLDDPDPAVAETARWVLSTVRP